MPHSGQSTSSSVVKLEEDIVSRVIQYAVVIMALASCVILTTLLVLDGLPHSLMLRFNPYALLSVASLVSNVVALILISRIKTRSPVLWWFSLHLLSLAAWAGSEIMIRLSTTPAGAVFWSPWTTLGSMFMPISLYMFVLAYTNSRWAQRSLTLLSMMGCTALFIYTDAHTSILTRYNVAAMTPSPWGYIPATGPAYLLITLWLIAICAVSIIILYRFRRRTIDPILRKQTSLFMIAIAIPLVGGGITDGILPALNIVAVPPLAATMLTAMGLIISYGILRYRFFRITPSAIASQILDTMSEAVIGLDDDLHISFANAGAQRLLGHSAANLSHRNFGSLLVQPWTSVQLGQHMQQILGGKDVGTLDSLDFHAADGGVMTAKLSITRIYSDEQPYGYLIVLTDITAIAQAKAIIEAEVAMQTRAVREGKAKLVHSLNSLGLGFMITDDKPEVTLVNNAAHILFCVSRDHEAVACPDITLAGIEAKFGTEASLRKAIHRCLATKHPQEIKAVSFRHQSWRIFVSPMIDGDRATGTAVVIQDITEEQVLARSHDEFFSIASHELRTPLTAIKGNSAMMLQYYAEMLKDPTLHEMVTDIHGASDRLIMIVNDFLDVSSLEQGKIRFKLAEVSVADVVRKVAADQEVTAKERGLYIRLGAGLTIDDPSPAVIVDPDRLKQILYNLIGNAVKCTDKGGVTLEAVVAHQRLKINVIDTGFGITPEMQHLLFRKFQQAGTSLLTRDGAKGTGLGLYISRLMAKGMHGTVELTHSEVGKGTTFTLMLPIATPDRLARLEVARKPVTVDAASGLVINKSSKLAKRP